MKSFFALASTLAISCSLVSGVPVNNNNNNLQKRESGTATFFQPGLGSCGGTDDASSMIVAINSAQGSGNQHCGQQVSITNDQTGQSVTATITDLCPTCNSGDLDLSPAVFQALGGTEAQGVFPISWNFGGSSDGGNGGNGQSGDDQSGNNGQSGDDQSSNNNGGNGQSGSNNGKGGNGGNSNKHKGSNRKHHNKGNKSKKRNSGTATFFAPGLGSCGQTDDESSMIVAINSAQGSGNKFCGKKVSITNKQTGKSIKATVRDLCPTCSYGDLDMSPAVFKSLGGTEQQGIFPIEWTFA